ncbi:MAG TPA: cyclic nucleotide-binding domain-containing protein [Gammaproteobacteria bacterium]|nr:cyclic nucleotide-binding domain-containing protein [Gammaproteobacteria bacterium]
METYPLVIIGAGPAGLSAAGRAAAYDQQSGRETPGYILLEGYEAHAKTIQRYQLRKLVMAEPGFLDLRSDFGFQKGSREEVLSAWSESLQSQRVIIRFGAEVSGISGTKGNFEVRLANGEKIAAGHIVLAIGVAGNPRKLGVPGDGLPGVEYHLDDPEAFEDETIIVIGAGDAAIENAVALSAQNDVIIINRGDEFSRAKDGNLKLILNAINDPAQRLSCFYNTKTAEVTAGDDGKHPLTIVLDTPNGQKPVPCNRIIARLGSIPPRRFLESAGVKLPNARPDALPELSRTYESNVEGLYIIGSLAGYPLIKQAMNQGHDVVEYINGNFIKPADQPLLEYQFHGLPFRRDAAELLDLFQHRIPMFRQLNALAFRELIIEGTIIASYGDDRLYEETERSLKTLSNTLRDKNPRPRITRIIREGEYIYRKGDFGASMFTIAEGEVILEADEPGQHDMTLSRGEFFGESSLISGRPRLDHARAGANCLLVETPRRIMVKLMNSNEEVRRGIDWIFIVRELRRHFAPRAGFADLREIAEACEVRHFKAGEVVFKEGEVGDSLHLVRSGSVTLMRHTDKNDLVLAQVPSGQLVGEMALMGDPVRRETAIATLALETIEIRRPQFLELISREDAQIERLQADVTRHVIDHTLMEVRPEAGAMMQFLMSEGLGEATNAIIINEDLCVGCDNCEKACAETHNGISRLDRKSGNTFAHIHVPISCRHCEQPHCMKDCPPDAIHRAVDGQVFIDETCIGCGNCEANCPYDAIRMEYDAPEKPGLLQWLLLGRGPGPGETPGYTPDAAAKEKGKKAVKCDACLGRKGGPACVNACPTGAAIRIGPERFIELLDKPAA